MRLFGKQKTITHEKQKIDPAMLEGIKAPVLILDSLWQEHYKNRKSLRVAELEKKIIELLKEQGRLNDNVKNLNLKKKDHLKRILSLSDTAHNKHNPDDREALAAFGQAVTDINDQIIMSERKADAVAPMLDMANRELLAETVSDVFNDMREARKLVQTLDPQIDSLKTQLKTTIELRDKADADAVASYQLLHKLVGGRILNMLHNALGDDGA
ncbi:MAG: hypothetical protein LBL96_08590 [Clostridiales bacterium]|jgi:hypothetical protein|nr:hypothetical protein [Clostridiales bacterium]